MSKIKRWWLLLIIAIIAAFLLEVIQINTQPKASMYTVSEQLTEQEKNLYPNQITGISGYCITGQELIVEEEDPQMYFSIENSGLISYMYFHFQPVSKAGMRIQIFYPGEDGVYSEANSVVSECPAGVDFWPIEIPAAEYATLRIDIDGSSIPLESIGMGNVAPEMKRITPGIHWVRIVIVSVLLFAVLFWMAWCEIWTGMKKAIQGGIRGIRENKKRSVLYALAFPVAAGISVFLFWLFCTVFAGKPMTSPRIVFAILIGVFAACLFVFRKTLKAQPEYLFLVLVLCIGFLLCYYVPHTGLNSWDEDVHYTQALKTSYVDSVVMTQQDEITVARNVGPSYDLSGGGVKALHDQQDLMYHAGATERATFTSIATIPEVFNGIGLFAGRAFGMPYYMIHFMGRFFGLITYALLGFLGIRKLKSGKMIAAVTLMIPTAMFLASSYNYDSYLTGFTALGLCYYLAQWQDRDAKVTLKDAIIMIGSIAFGCITKAIYIPLLWILILLPKRKFANNKQHTWYLISIIAATALVAFTYILPSIFSSAQSDGDMRGGAEVSTSGQIRFILSDPLHFIRTIWNYLIDAYFNLTRLGELLTNYAYIGIMPNQYIYFLLLIAVCLTDKNEYDRELVHHPWAHIWPIILSLGVIILAITSMYLAFTPVGADYVAGAQFRYMIPMILPVLMHIGSGLVENKMDRGWYNGLVFGIAAFVGFATVYNGYICKYI